MSSPFEHLEFDNTFVDELPGDTEERNYRRQVRGACYSKVMPTPVEDPELVAHSPEMVETLGLSNEDVETPEFTEVMAGNALAADMDAYATCYGGHQFGSWAGQLGDGRAINLGEVVGRDGGRWELQLKGAGPTPYSRRGDGRAVLRSSIREFLCSEAMHHLGIPTTRALSLVTTGESVVRDMLYDGNPAPEPGAVVCRVSPSFLRFGNFQLFAARGDEKTLKTLADYAIRHYFSHVGQPGPRAYRRMLEEVCCRTADLIVEWMRVGFVHGVMNTDNMSMLGLTIDYGPYGWLEEYDPNWTPNTSDATTKRYRFGHQPQIAMWNLAQFGFALTPLIGDEKAVEETLTIYRDRFDEKWRAMMANKLGIVDWEPGGDDQLSDDLFELLGSVATDMTIFFRSLTDVDAEREKELEDNALVEPLRDAYYDEGEFEQLTPRLVDWVRQWSRRVRRDSRPAKRRREQMNTTNPRYVLRNYLAHRAIERSEQGDHSMVMELLDVMRNPYDEQPEYEEYATRRPAWADEQPGCTMLSCSS